MMPGKIYVELSSIVMEMLELDGTHDPVLTEEVLDGTAHRR